MSNIFKDSESLGKSNVKKWSENKKNTYKGCKIAARNFFLLLFSANLGLITNSFPRSHSLVKKDQLKETNLELSAGRIGGNPLAPNPISIAKQ